MQQTSKYQFNLVENTDDFSPAPLNQNMEKVEEELEGIEESLTEGLAEVMANLGTIGHNLRVETGSYTGTGTYGETNPKQLTFDLYPVLVMIVCTSSPIPSPPCILMRPAPGSIFQASSPVNMRMYVTWGEHTVSWYAGGEYYHANEANASYYYIALGY